MTQSNRYSNIFMFLYSELSKIDHNIVVLVNHHRMTRQRMLSNDLEKQNTIHAS